MYFIDSGGFGGRGGAEWASAHGMDPKICKTIYFGPGEERGKGDLVRH